jgi:hypothetical protein
MINYASDDQLVRELTADLTPVNRLASPLVRFFVWLALVVGIAVGLAMIQDLQPLILRFGGSLDLCASATGSLLTAVLAGVAALQLSLPDRKPCWALLPLPAAALWIGASAIDCLRSWAAVSAGSIALGGTDNCLLFILAVSIPLSVLFVLMLRSGYSLRPNLTSIACGLASGAAAATLLNFVHAHDATATDLAVHAFAVCAVILANRIFGTRFLMTKAFGSQRNKSFGQFELTSTTPCKPAFRTLQDRIEDAKDDAPENRPAFSEPIRTDHKGHIIRFHRPGSDGRGRNKSANP